MSKKRKKQNHSYQKAAGSLEHRLSMARDFSEMIDRGAAPEERALINQVLTTIKGTPKWAEYSETQRHMALLDLKAAARMAIIHHQLHG